MIPDDLATLPSRTVLARSMTEDELLTAITDALTLYGWRWTHIRRSDRALTMGHAGFPDIVAVRGSRVLAWELKAARGHTTDDQVKWLARFQGAGADALILHPRELDWALERLR